MEKLRKWISKLCRYLFRLKYLKVIAKKAKYLLGLFVFIILLRVFVFEFYEVESCSMEETLYAGDIIWVNKLQYGARLPLQPSDVPFLEALIYISGFNSWSQNTHWNYRRMKGTIGIKRSDIIVFTDPKRGENNLIKRCVGLPGDTLMILHNLRYANGLLQQEPHNTKFSFSVKGKDAALSQDTLIKYGFDNKDILWRKDDFIHLSMTWSESERLKQCSLVDTIFINDFPKGYWKDHLLFPSSNNYLYTFENFGPIIIPAKGKNIKLDSTNLAFYKDIITNYEHNSLKISGNSIEINNQATDNYTFKMDYFFMIGDNRYRSVDSRAWGFVPESAIIGKVGFILFSLNNEQKGLKKIQLNSLLKNIE